MSDVVRAAAIVAMVAQVGCSPLRDEPALIQELADVCRRPPPSYVAWPTRNADDADMISLTFSTTEGWFPTRDEWRRVDEAIHAVRSAYPKMKSLHTDTQELRFTVSFNARNPDTRAIETLATACGTTATIRPGSAYLSFGMPLGQKKVEAAFRSLPYVRSAQYSFLADVGKAADESYSIHIDRRGDGYRFVFEDHFGDCPSGCTDTATWVFDYEEGEVTLVEHRPSRRARSPKTSPHGVQQTPPRF